MAPAESPPFVYHAGSDGERDVLWKQYAVHVDLYKFYLDLTLKAVTVSYDISGAIVTYVFANDDDRLLIVALLLPVVVSLALADVFLYTARLMTLVRQDVFAIRDALGLQIAPDVNILSIVLKVFAAVLLLTALGLSVLVMLRWPL